jgi:hypothetical protein
MGTRGAWGFRIGGQDKVTYNHFDSYPEGLGDDLIAALRTRAPKRGEGVRWITALRQEAERIRMTDGKGAPSREERERLHEFLDTGVSSQSEMDWYCLLRRTQGHLENTLAAGVMIDSQDFLRDSLWCEWAYIINLDDETLEVYRGFQKSPHQLGRYSRLPKTKESGNYYPVALVAAFPLNRLPTPLARALPGEEEE